MEVLVPINNPDTARLTVEYTVREYPEASITVMHVTPQNAAYGIGGMYVHDPEMEASSKYTEELFETAAEIAESNGGSISTMTAVGSPVREITAYAEESGTDHVVIGNCGRSGLPRLLLRNVTDGVVHRSPVSVTVVK